MFYLPDMFSSKLLSAMHGCCGSQGDVGARWKDGDLLMEFCLPGFEKGQISVTRRDRMLTVKASLDEELEKGYSGPRRSSYRQDVVLPRGLDEENDVSNKIILSGSE